jgi:hypothetical protein
VSAPQIPAPTDPGTELEARIAHYEQVKTSALRLSSLHQNPKAKQMAKEQSEIADRVCVG